MVWTTLCIGLGLFVGSRDFGGKSPWQALSGAWKQQAAPRLEKAKEGAEDLVDGVKRKVSTQDPAVAQPKERHNEEDRKAIDQIISKRSKG